MEVAASVLPLAGRSWRDHWHRVARTVDGLLSSHTMPWKGTVMQPPFLYLNKRIQTIGNIIKHPKSIKIHSSTFSANPFSVRKECQKSQDRSNLHPEISPVSFLFMLLSFSMSGLASMLRRMPKWKSRTVFKRKICKSIAKVAWQWKAASGRAFSILQVPGPWTPWSSFICFADSSHRRTIKAIRVPRVW